ncbi:hypothetical protein [Herbiconiux sp. L3-i23]|uniref:hypothetical protein n=1 Tax=Herbiconiux sp. L3-i23 TaxID=2905871 RepID=UPI002060B038|nr:hypothetical protein [Herbiconiux sp. L3-i23]BDI23897.1 hypothetical protein L3i23_26730 [Herbiconiux sp. L3-i23]
MDQSIDHACVLVPGDVHLSTTGADVAGIVVIAGALVALGVVALLCVMVLRRRSSSRARGLAAAALAGVLFLFGSAAATPAPANAADSCSLLGWSLLETSPQESSFSLGTEATDVLALTLKNVTDMPIAIALRTEIKSDADGIAPWVQLVGDCTACNPVVVYDATMGTRETGPQFSLAPGQSVDLTVSARLLDGLPSTAQDKRATFSLIAMARQI